MKNRLTRLFILPSTFFVSMTSMAEEMASAPVVVTATRTAQIADNTLAPVIIINRQEIETSPATDVAGLLSLHAGLDVARNGGPGQATSLFIRGTDSNHTLVMLDGLKINPGTIGGAALQNISADNIERIEIVKGPRSTLYGSEAIGGVINIITRQTTNKMRSSLSVEHGRYDSNNANVDLQYRRENVRAGITANWLESNGFSPKSSSAVSRGHDNTTINTHLGIAFSLLAVELSHWQAQGNTEYLDFFDTSVDQDFSNSASGLTLKANPSDEWATSLTLGHITDEIDQNQSNDFAHTQRNSIDWQNDIQLNDENLLTTGIWISREHTASAVFGSGFDEDTNVNAAFVQNDMQTGNNHLLLSARSTDHDGFGSHTTWGIEYGYRINHNTRVTLGSGTAFRAPDSTDRFGFGGNPNLSPENSRNTELGLSHQFSKQQQLSINIFDNKIHDLIEYDLTSSLMKNTGKAHIRGIDANYSAKFKRVAVSINAITQKPENEDTGEDLARRAKHSVTSSVTWQGNRYRVTVEMLASGKRKDSAFSTDYNAGYGLVNVGSVLNISKTLDCYASVENLFDKRYETAKGFNTAAQTITIGLRYQPEE